MNVLDEAADIIEQRGWTQNDYFSRYGECCLLGGLIAAITGFAGPDWDDSAIFKAENSDEFYAADVALLAELGSRGYDEFVYPSSWNDEPGRTKAEVLDVMRAAARRLDA